MSTVAYPRLRGIIIEGKVVIPSWVDDLASFRAWRASADAPTSGEVAYLGSDIWVDLSMEEFLTHNQVKAAFDFAIMGIVQAAASGRYVPERMLLTNESAELSTEPDGLFFAWETVTSGRLRLVERADQGIIELEGAPDMLLEIVSKNSLRKDTVVLRELYWKAGVTEYWLVDVRDGALSFEILRHTADGYVPVGGDQRWIRSGVFGKKFQLDRRTDPIGHPQFLVLVEGLE
jgi:Uma2 family endonuclease